MRKVQFLFASLVSALTLAVLLAQPASWQHPATRKAQFLLATVAIAVTLTMLLAQPAAATYPPGSCTGCQ